MTFVPDEPERTEPDYAGEPTHEDGRWAPADSNTGVPASTADAAGAAALRDRQLERCEANLQRALLQERPRRLLEAIVGSSCS